MKYSEHPNTGLVQYSNGLFQLELGILIPDHFMYKKNIILYVKWPRLADHLETGPVSNGEKQNG
jgi:hypothetical protein